ncbi:MULTISPECIES: EcsC family protein [unclassified Sphingomonas]|uniref:EcsC family protein n=1 Tax=unclassified Sphingomonas TaxID=196159 RepID=UPI000BDAC9E3|nr:MAG: hypothetical protein B7Y98_05895 [Sphingomonas sp. 32-62-10]OYY64767.1 MAG: hypothetical protein B7Y49_08450 [Sphingomonas sp. 28-62-11]
MADSESGNACAAFTESELQEMLAIARIHEDAGGWLLTLAANAGEGADKLIDWLPDNFEDKLQGVVDLALRQSYAIAANTHGRKKRRGGRSIPNRERFHRIATGVAGAIGGAGGIATTLADLAITTTLILRSIQQIAASYGEDLDDPDVRTQCIAVFGTGGPLVDDDSLDTGLWAGRIALSHQTVSATIRTIVPQFGKSASEGILTRAAPLVGAVAGASINSSFTRYYQQMAHVNFRLRRLSRRHPPGTVLACFARVVAMEQDQRKSKDRKKR